MLAAGLSGTARLGALDHGGTTEALAAGLGGTARLKKLARFPRPLDVAARNKYEGNSQWRDGRCP